MSLFGLGKNDIKKDSARDAVKDIAKDAIRVSVKETNVSCCEGNSSQETQNKEATDNKATDNKATDNKATDNKATGNNEQASVKVLGSGCEKCNHLEANVKTALTQLGMDTSIEHITDFAQIAAYGVMSTPALVVDGKVVSFGKVLKVEEAVKLLQKIR